MPARLPDPEKYNDFIRHLELVDVYLKESRSTFARRPSGALSYQIHETTKRPLVFEGGFEAGIHYRLELYEDAKEGEPQLFGRIEALWVAIYNSPRPPDSNTFNIFKQLNLPVNLWPYFRVLVHNTSAQAGIPYLVLPARKTLSPKDEVTKSRQAKPSFAKRLGG